jgi:hypothetical protein
MENTPFVTRAVLEKLCLEGFKNAVSGHLMHGTSVMLPETVSGSVPTRGTCALSADP